jgi:hypothetical protein
MSVQRIRRLRLSRYEPHVSVEFLDDDAQPIEPDETAGGRRRPSLALIAGLVAALSVAWIATRKTEAPTAVSVPPVAAQPALASIIPSSHDDDRTFTVPGDVASPIGRTMTRAMPGISISDVTIAGEGPAITRSVDARYHELMITVEIVSGKPTSGPTVQTIAYGPSAVIIIHNRPRSARRTVTVTVIAPQHTHIPVAGLHLIADEIGRLRST